MIEKMLEKTKQYLEKTLSKEGKYLLALSGGPDSLALFYILIEGGWNFHICHVDHGWRKESSAEASKLHLLAQKYSIPFYLHKIDPNELVEGNLEDSCRKKRLLFFKQEYVRGDFDALFTGHHADDQVETILKRVFEGSFLTHISAMKEESNFEGMRLVRPLLCVFKKEILKYLEVNNIEFFEDSTNSDPKFLRSRMRMDMIPYLEEMFGKGIKGNILLLGKRIEECMHYVNKQVEEKFNYIYPGPFGYYLATSLLKKELEGETLLREILQKEKIDISRGEMEQLLVLIRDRKDQKKIIKGDWKLVLERDHLFVLKLPLLPCYTISELPSYRPPDDWKGIWGGSSAVYFPELDCLLGPPKLSNKLPNGMELREWYRIHKVPVFLRSWMPVIWDKGQIVGECLTGKSCLNNQPIYANHLLTLK